MAETTEVLVIGAGIAGLTAALALVRAGHQVLVAEAGGAPGAGASGGLVGALSPHMPDAWNPRKQAQFKALIDAQDYWAGVSALAGIDSGYARTGRWLPLASARAADLAHARTKAAAQNWRGLATWRVAGPGDLPGWIDPASAPHGAVHETLSARIAPRTACRALAGALAALGGELRCGWRALSVQLGADGNGQVQFDKGRLAARHIVLATGAAAPPAGVHGPPVVGVKGQAALLAGGLPPATPMLYADGLYVVPHGDGTVAIGSTTETSWSDPQATDAALDALIARARAICPPLADALVAARWAGLRPRAPRPDPVVGTLAPGLHMLNGGFRTGLALAPLLAQGLSRLLAGKDTGLPTAYGLTAHRALTDQSGKDTA